MVISDATTTSEGGQFTMLAAIGRDHNWNIDNYEDRCRIFKEDVGGGGGLEVLSLRDTGRVGIGDSDPDQKLTVNGSIGYTSLVDNSDERAKYDINLIKNPIEKILKLTGRSFKWKPEIVESDPNNLSGLKYGFIAQEVEKVLPKLVTTISGSKYNIENFKSIEIHQIIPLLVGAVKEQQKQIDQLKNQINT